MFPPRLQKVEETQQICVGKSTKHSSKNFIIPTFYKAHSTTHKEEFFINKYLIGFSNYNLSHVM